MAIEGRPAVILLAEDDLGDQELVRRALDEGKMDYRLHVVEDGEDVLNYLYRRERYADRERFPLPDLILMDLNMPRLDGRHVLHTLKTHPVLRCIPVVVLTTSRQDREILQCYESGANSCIVKPTGAEELIELVRLVEKYWFEAVMLPPLKG